MKLPIPSLSISDTGAAWCKDSGGTPTSPRGRGLQKRVNRSFVPNGKGTSKSTCVNKTGPGAGPRCGCVKNGVREYRLTCTSWPSSPQPWVSPRPSLSSTCAHLGLHNSLQWPQYKTTKSRKGSALHLVNAVGPEPTLSSRPLAALPLFNFATSSTRMLTAVLDHIYDTACGPRPVYESHGR